MISYPNFFNEPCICECCGPRMTAFTTSTGVAHKWTKQEIKDEIERLAKELVFVKWYERKGIREHLKHWVEKLERFEEAKSEFKL